MLEQSQAPMSPTAGSDRSFFIFNALVSAAALAFLAWLLLLHGGISRGGVDLSFMPAVNAGFNALSASLLVAGYVAIRRGARAVHQRLMVSAFASSALFLVGYVAYHYVHGDTKFVGTGPIRSLYFIVLISHVLLSMGVVPMALAAFYFAFKKRFAAHKKVTRVLLPVWLYVSVTGVAIYFLLKSHS